MNFILLERFNMQDCKPIDTPISKGDGLCLEICPKEPIAFLDIKVK